MEGKSLTKHKWLVKIISILKAYNPHIINVSLCCKDGLAVQTKYMMSIHPLLLMKSVDMFPKRIMSVPP
jgi:hypothetical protein